VKKPLVMTACIASLVLVVAFAVLGVLAAYSGQQAGLHHRCAAVSQCR
jgi:hypothetical protein